MEDIFAGEAQKLFVSLFDKFQNNMLKMWPDCEEAKDLNIMFMNVIKGDDSKEKEMIQQWYDNLTIKLSKKVKYCKPVERIIQDSAILYHACEYNDIDALEKTSEAQVLQKLDIFEKYRDDTMTTEDKKIFWKYLRALNEQCFKYFEKNPPFVPSREQIQKNIKEQKMQKTTVNDELPSMNKAFQSSFSELCKSCAFADTTQNMNEESIGLLMARWASFTKESIEGMKTTTLCNQKNDIVFTVLSKHVPEVNLENFVVTDEIWNLINQLNGYASVGQNIPTKMMGKIENLATKLADDIVNGRADLSSMNLNEIGQEVLSQCDESDMSTFANNIDSLLPALQHFQKSM